MSKPKLVALSKAQKAQPPPLSDEDLALRLAARLAERMRYVHAWRRWFEWTGTYWRFDATRLVDDLARGLCREAANENTRIASRAKVSAVCDLVQTDRRLALTSDVWDAHADLFQAMTTIDLRTGTDHKPKPELYITKRAGTASAGGESPRWRKFLNRVTNGDEELQRYLQRVAGYCLTGHTSEHALFFLYGTGANGKSIFANTLLGLWGDYACASPMEAFTETRSDRHPTELARLQGVRLVIATETSGNSRWNEARIKSITGGDVISARFMHADYFDFTPKFKLMVMGNRKPSLRQVDEAMRRRVHLVPFTVTIPPAERDPDLFDKLKEEWPGILQWAVDGCAMWRAMGLAPPTAVTEATEAYLAEENSIAVWLSERCVEDAGAWETSASLYASWRHWCEQNGEEPGTSKAFAQSMEANGAIPQRRNQGRGMWGFRVKL